MSSTPQTRWVARKAVLQLQSDRVNKATSINGALDQVPAAAKGAVYSLICSAASYMEVAVKEITLGQVIAYPSFVLRGKEKRARG